MNTFYWVSNYILEFLKLNIFVFGIFNCPSKGKKMQWIPSVVAAVTIGAASILGLPEDGVILGITLLLIGNTILVLKKKKDIVLVIFSFLLLVVIETILDGTMRMLMPYHIWDSVERDITDFLLNVFTGICLLGIEGILHKKKDTFYFSAKNVTVIFMGLLAMMMYLYPIQYSYSQLKDDGSKLIYSMLGVAVSSIIFLIICFVNLKSIHEKEIYREKSEAYREYVKKQEIYYKGLLQKENATRQFRHDMLNHLTCLRIYLEDGEISRAEEYLNEMTGATQSLTRKIVTGNDIIDVVASDVFYGESEVVLKWMGKFPSNTNISDMDLCILFSNLLKNALEAAKLYDGKEKEVDVHIKEFGSNYFIFVKNPCKSKPVRKNNKFITSKKDKENHGFGMLNIEQIVKKYNGIINYEYGENTFMVQIDLEDIRKK